MAFPTTSILDAFNRANEGPPPSANWTADPFNVSTVGHEVISNAASNGQHTYWSAASFAADQEAYVTISNLNGGTGCGLFMRVQSPGTSGADGYECNWNGTTVSVTRVIDAYAVETTIDSVTTTAAATGYKFGVEVTGTGATVTIKCYIDTGSGWTLVLTASDTGGTRITSGGYIGMFSQPVTSLDDFGGGDVIYATLDQAATRFRDDDGSETGATWLASQNTNITRTTDTNTRIRFALQAVSDPSSSVYAVQVNRNSGGWVTVAPPVSFSAPVFGAIGTGASGTTTCSPSYPTGITANSALFLCVTGRSNTASTAFAITGGGWTLIEDLEDGTGTWGVDTGTRRAAVYRKDVVTGTESGTITVTLAGTTANTMRATITRVEIPAGHTLSVASADGADTTNGTSYSAATTSLDLAADDLLLIVTAQNIDTGTVSAQSLTASGLTFGTISSRATTAVTNGNDHRHIVHTAPVSTGTGTGAVTWAYTCSANCSGPTVIVRLRMSVTPVAAFLSPSANIAAGAATATTQQLTGLTGTFTAGKISDDTKNLTVDLANNGNTELEWCVQASSAVCSATDTLDWRVTKDGVALDTYTNTPRWTIATPSGEDAGVVATLTKPTLAGNFTVARTVAAAMAPAPLALAASATVDREAAGDMSAPAATLQAAGGPLRDAAGAMVVPASVLEASAAVSRAAQAAMDVPAPTLAASAAVDRSASGDLDVPAPVLAAAAAVDRTAEMAGQAPALTLEALAGNVRDASGALVSPAPVLAASADPVRVASGALAVPMPVLSAAFAVARTVAAALDVGPLALIASCDAGRVASGAFTLPAVELSAAGARIADASAAMTLPVPVLTAAVSVVRLASGECVLALPILSATGAGEEAVVSAAMTFPVPVLDSDGLVTRTASGALVLQAPVLDADALRIAQVSGVLLLRPMTLDAQAAIERIASGDLDVPSLQLLMSGYVGILEPLCLTTTTVVSLVPVRTVLAISAARRVVALVPLRTVRPYDACS